MHFLGIEIGGTKLQAAIGSGEDEKFLAIERRAVALGEGADGIRRELLDVLPALLARANICRDQIAAVGIAFGGPVDVDAGETVVSHQVPGWERFPLVQWVADQWGLPAALANDADCAAMAEARFGAGQGVDPVLYVTVGSGIGGGLIVGGRIYRGAGGGAMEIGHLRPGHLTRHIPAAGETVESVASGFGISHRARQVIEGWQATHDFAQSFSSPHRRSTDRAFQERFSATRDRFSRLLELAGNNPDNITTTLIGLAAQQGDRLSVELLSDATRVLGWALAQAITLLNPARIVIGGGVSLSGEELFFGPVRQAVAEYVFGPFAGTAEIVPAALGEEVVVHGALTVARDACSGRATASGKLPIDHIKR